MEELGWWTLAVVGIATFSFTGILEIGWEIENPFGWDANDLPLDDFCKVIKREIDRVISQPPVHAEDWIFSDANRPFAPDCMMSAKDLARRPASHLSFICGQQFVSPRVNRKRNGMLQIPEESTT